MRARLTLLGWGLIALAAAGWMGRGVVRHRAREYDRWKTHGFGLYLFREGRRCCLCLQGPARRPGGARALDTGRAELRSSPDGMF